MTENSTEITDIASIDSSTLAVPEAGWKRRLVVDKESGKITLSHKDAVEAWRDFAVEETKRALLSGKLTGNRNAGAAKMALFQKFIDGDTRTEEDFKALAFEMNFNPETAENYWIQYQVLFQKKFREYLINAKFPQKKENKNDILEF